jgi:hypothetical protein
MNICFFVDKKFSAGSGHSKVVRETFVVLDEAHRNVRLLKAFEFYYGMYIKYLHNSKYKYLFLKLEPNRKIPSFYCIYKTV